MNIKEKFGKIPFPGWLFTALMVVYNEMMLHTWVTETLQFRRVSVVAAFALGFGLVMAVLASLFSRKAGKWVAVGISLIVTVIWITEYFISDAYRVFMTPVTVINGAGGVAQDYFDLVVSLLTRNLWRILLMLLPIVLYALFCRSPQTRWSLRGMLAAAAVGFYLLGFDCIAYSTKEINRLKEAYNFDGAVRSFGLNMALTLEAVNGGKETGEPSFVTTAPIPMETEAQETDAAEETAATEPAPVYEDNVIAALDFESLSASEVNSKVAAMHNYVASLTPSKQNEFTGLFKGKNLILITAEAFSQEVINPELTPTLYRMANEGIRFEEYYQPLWGASTTSGEFSNVVGLVPTTGGSCMLEATQQDLFLTMGHQLQGQNYYSAAYHNHLHDFYNRNKTHTHLGYDRFVAMYGGLEGVDAVWPESDVQLIEATIGDYIDQQPFSIYYMTVSGHCVYNQKENVQSRRHYDKVAHLDYSDTVKCYLASQLELEYAMETLLNRLEEAGILDDTVIAIGTDHYPYGLERSSTWKNDVDFVAELYGVETYDQFRRDRSALILWSGCLEDMDLVVEDPVYSLDILPTLSNLFGVEYDSRLLVGRDVFSDAEPIALWPDYSWKTDKGSYNAKTGEFVPEEGVEVPQGYVEYISSLVANKITYSGSVMQMNYFNYLSKALGRRE